AVEFSRGTLEQVLECLPCAAFVCDEQHRVVAQNRLAAQQLAIVPGDTMLPPAPGAQSSPSSEHSQRWTTQLTSPSGRTLEAELAARRISVEGQRMLLVILHELPAAARSE